MHISKQGMNVYPNINQSFAIVGILILGMIVFMPVYFLLNKIMENGVSFLVYYLLAVGISFYIIGIIKKKKTGNNSYNFTIRNKRIIPLIIVGIIVLYFGIISPITALIPMSESTKASFLNAGKLPGIFIIFQSVIVAPILEELIFTGIILDGLFKKYSPLKSILITGLLFGLVHLDRFQFVTVLIMGIFTGWVYYRTRCLTFTILIHAVANLTSVFMRYFIISDSLIDNVFYRMYGGMTNMIFAVVASVVILVFCVHFLKIEFNKMNTKIAANNR